MIELILSIIASLIAEILVYVVKNSFRPNIELSSVISHGEDFGKPCYLIKVINKSKRPAFNLKAEMFIA